MDILHYIEFHSLTGLALCQRGERGYIILVSGTQHNDLIFVYIVKGPPQ